MSDHLCITVRWLGDRYHGLLDRDGPPEWPPSPFRLLQALVAGVARRGELDSTVGQSLKWLETCELPLIIAPRAQDGQVVTRFVPNNDGDKVLDRQNRLTAKTSRPTIMLDSPEVHYLWPVPEDCPQAQRVIDAARSLTCLGWGIDMAYAEGRLFEDEHIGQLQGVRWFPRLGAIRDDGLLRVPVKGTVDDLRRAHQSALKRIEPGQPLRTIDKPRIFDAVFYASSERPLGRPHAVFQLLRSDGDPYQHAHAKLIEVAGMVRHAALEAVLQRDNWPEDAPDDWAESFVAGHSKADAHRQFSYLPLPSIGHQHADAQIRRVMLAAPVGCDLWLGHVANLLDGQQLKPESGAEGPILQRIRGDGVTRQYVASSDAWATVTPVILPGHTDRRDAKVIKLIEKALLQAGIDQPCKFEWSVVPYFKNTLAVHAQDRQGRRAAYFRPTYLRDSTAVHLRLCFGQPVTGPIAVGSGRHCGLGVFAAIKSVAAPASAAMVKGGAGSARTL